MTTITLPANGWAPRDYQFEAWQALQNPNLSTYILAWARRHGKDEIALHATAIKALQRVGNYYHALPQYSQARKAIWEARDPHTGLIRWQQAFPKEIIKHVDNQTMMVTFINGSTWQLVGSDSVDSLMGTTPAGVVFSEAALADDTTYAFFRPILLENNGWSIHVSSVRGKNHFHSLYEAHKDNESSYVSHISARDTNVFTEAQLDQELRTYVRLYGEALGRSLFEQEYLSDWDAAAVGSVWGKELRDMQEEGRILTVPYDSRFPVHTSWDIGISDPTAILFWQSVGGIERLIDWYQNTELGLEHYAQVLRDKGYLYGEHYWPHDGSHREWGAGISRSAQAKRLGLKVTPLANISKKHSIALGSQLLKRTVINADLDFTPSDPQDDCTFVLETLKGYRFKLNPATRMLSRNPVHDQNSHIADALQTYAIAKGADFSLGTATPAENLDDHSRFNGTRIRTMLNKRKGSVRGAFG